LIRAAAALMSIELAGSNNPAAFANPALPPKITPATIADMASEATPRGAFPAVAMISSNGPNRGSLCSPAK
jgi:hypothetical protein